MYSDSDQYVHNVVNNTNPNKEYTGMDLAEVTADYKKGKCPLSVVEYVESKVKSSGIDAFDLAKKIEDAWRESLIQSIASGAMSGKDVKNIRTYIKLDNGEYRQISNAYSHHGMGVILDYT